MVEPISVNKEVSVPFSQQVQRVERDHAERENAARAENNRPPQPEQVKVEGRRDEAERAGENENPNREGSNEAERVRNDREPQNRNGIPNERGNFIDLFA